MSLLSQGVEIGDVFAPAAKFSKVSDLVTLGGRVAALAGGFLVVASFAYSAYFYMSAHGDTKNIEKAKTAMTYSIVGLVIVAAAYWITQLIAKFLGQNF